MKLTRNRIFLILLGAAIVAALVFAFQPEPIAVDSATAERGPLMVTVDEERHRSERVDLLELLVEHARWERQDLEVST